MSRAGTAVAGAIGPLLILAVAPDGCAEPRIGKGTRELALHISPDFESAIGDTIFVEAGYGVFVRDRLQVRGTYSYTLMEDIAGNDNDYRMSELALVGEYHFRVGNAFVPYVGLELGWSQSQFGDFDESALVYGPRAGLKYFMADNVALAFEAAYKFAGTDVFINDFTAEDTDLTLAFGLRVMF
jgi:hypothetical protein